MKLELIVIVFIILSIIGSAYIEPPILVTQNPFQHFTKQPYSLQIYYISFNTTCTNNSLLMSSIEGIIDISYQCQVSNIKIKFLTPKDKFVYQYKNNDWENIQQSAIGITDDNYFVVLTTPETLGTFKISNKTSIINVLKNTSNLEKYVVKKDYDLYERIKLYILNIINMIINKDNELYEGFKNWK